MILFLLSALTLLVGRLEGHPAHKTLGVGLLVVSFALHVLQLQLSPPSLILCVNKIQNGDILLPACPGCPRKWPLYECRRHRLSLNWFVCDVHELFVVAVVKCSYCR